MAVFLKERDPKSAAEMIEWAEKYGRPSKSERTRLKRVSQTQQPSIQRESTLQEVHEDMNHKINDLSDEIKALQQSLQNFKENTKHSEHRLQRENSDRDKEIIRLKTETEVWRKERDEMCKQQWVTVGDFEEKVRELELGHKKQSDDLQKTLAEIKFFKERNECMKKELDNTVTKEKSLEVEIANAETKKVVERLTKLIREFKQIYDDERKTKEVYLDMRHQMSSEMEETTTDIGTLTKEFEVHQTFKELKTALGKVKKKRAFSENYYGTTFKELGYLLLSFDPEGKNKKKIGDPLYSGQGSSLVLRPPLPD
ncbi:coiled-coil domain-containing protein 171-like [Pomacea canaliculata]|uniref:coiled-coil domain-containing protein 171-like n=1 Tax=Pomacea canaliculata TaxID=400727 RepID=UPI000D7342A6|nr:coiled-coil domain-containing protein 171-like [Pomacea canaliculata]